MELNSILTIIQNLVKNMSKKQFLAIAELIYDIVVKDKED